MGTYSLWNSLRYGASLHTVLASCVTSRRFSELSLRAVPLPGVFRAGKSPSRAQIAPRQAPQQRYRGLVWPLRDEIGPPNLVGALRFAEPSVKGVNEPFLTKKRPFPGPP